MEREFELYGRRFRWCEEGEPPVAADHTPLVRRRTPVTNSGNIEWFDHGGWNRPQSGRGNGGFVYRFAGTAEFWLARDGSLAHAYVQEDAEPWAIDFVLNRGVLPRLLHLQGCTCLHASAVRIGQRLVALCGPSGAGKSTLAAILVRRGCRLVGDDVLPIRIEPSGISAGPGLPEIRVYPAAAERLGIAADSRPPRAGQTKAVWRPSSIAEGAAPPSHIYLLQPASGAAASIHRASPHDALRWMLSNSFWLHPGETSALATDLACFAQVVRSVPISYLSFDFAEMDAAAAAVLSSEECR